VLQVQIQLRLRITLCTALAYPIDLFVNRGLYKRTRLSCLRLTEINTKALAQYNSWQHRLTCIRKSSHYVLWQKSPTRSKTYSLWAYLKLLKFGHPFTAACWAAVIQRTRTHFGRIKIAIISLCVVPQLETLCRQMSAPLTRTTHSYDHSSALIREAFNIKPIYHCVNAVFIFRFICLLSCHAADVGQLTWLTWRWCGRSAYL